MTHSPAAAKGLDIVQRWCLLAERRLDYLTELYETGRWRRFHTKADFLDNFREARTAVETWHALAGNGGTPDNLAVDLSWLDRPNGVPSPSEAMRPIAKDAGLMVVAMADIVNPGAKPDFAALATLAPDQFVGEERHAARAFTSAAAAMPAAAPVAQVQIAQVQKAEVQQARVQSVDGVVWRGSQIDPVVALEDPQQPAWSVPSQTLAPSRYPSLRIAF